MSGLLFDWTALQDQANLITGYILNTKYTFPTFIVKLNHDDKLDSVYMNHSVNECPE